MLGQRQMQAIWVNFLRPGESGSVLEDARSTEDIRFNKRIQQGTSGVESTVASSNANINEFDARLLRNLLLHTSRHVFDSRVNDAKRT